MHLEHKRIRQKFLAILQDPSDFFVQTCVGVFWSQNDSFVPISLSRFLVPPLVAEVFENIFKGGETSYKGLLLLLLTCPTLCDPIDGSPPGSPVPGILQARTLEWVAISSSDA